MLNPQNVNNGEEQYEYFIRRVGRKSTRLCQYDYRHFNGKVFSCVAKSLEICRERKNAWLLDAE